jgi:hypothetical protein
MIVIEKVNATGLNTDIAPDAIEKLGGDRKIVNPILDCLNKRYVSSDNGQSYKIENIKGTVLKSIGLSSGTNKCIGAYEDYLNNQVINWVYNSNGNHCVVAYSPETDAVTFLLQNVSSLNFQSNGRKISAGVIGDLLYWSDGFNDSRVINMTRSYSYTGFDISHITLAKIQPVNKPTFGGTFAAALNDSVHPRIVRVYDSAITVNRIYNKNFQFAYRWKFLDDEYSLLSPFSDMNYGEYFPMNFQDTANVFKYTYGNKIHVTVLMPDNADKLLKQVEILVRENNTGNWKIWRIFRSNEFINSGITFTPLSDYFTGAEPLSDVDQSQTSKLSESIPNFSTALCVHKNRVFCVDDEEGFDVQKSVPVLNLSTFSYLQAGVAAFANGGYSVKGNLSTGWVATSTTSFTVTIKKVGTTFTVSGASAFANMVGSRVELRNSGLGVYCTGIVTAYNSSSSIDIHVDIIYTGAGVTASSWNIKGVVDTYKTYWKSGGVFNIGLAVFDARMRPMGIISKSTVRIPDAQYNGSSPAQFFVDNLLNVAIAGNLGGTPKAKYYSLCASADQRYSAYHRSMVEVMFYKFDAPTNYTPSSSEYIYNGMVFYKTAPTFTSPVAAKLYFRLPREFPIVMDTSWKIRLTSIYQYFNGTEGNLYDANLLALAGDVVKTNSDFGISGNGSTINYTTFMPYFGDRTRNRYTVQAEFYKEADVSPEFYEITDRYSIDNSGNLSVTNFNKIQGNTYVLPQIYLNFDGFTIPYTTNISAFKPYINAAQGAKADAAVDITNVESQTPISTQLSTQDSPFISAAFSFIIEIDFPASGRPGQKSVASDYQKIAWRQGKSFIELIDKVKSTRTSVIRFSNKFVQASKINGLSAFDSGDQHTVSLDRGDIMRLVSLSNNILCVHSWASTVLYTEEGLLRTADDNSTLIKSGEVIGHDRALQGGYGTIHPESIAQYDNLVFGWDNYQGVVWQYTNEGQQDVSSFGMREYFRQKQLLINKDSGARVYGMIDPFHNEYIITFSFTDTTKNQTLAYNFTKNQWTTRYSFIPEMGVTLNKLMISFKSGQLYIHNQDSVNYNRFYGVNYQAFIKIAVNPAPTRVKNWAGLQLSCDALTSSSNPDFKVIEVFTPEGQYSFLMPDEFDLYEKTYYGSIFRDVNTPAVLIPAGKLARMDGDDVKSKYLIVQINEDVAPTKNSIQQLNVTYVSSEYSR